MQEARRGVLTRSRLLLALLAAVVLAADQLTKLAVVRALPVGESRPMLGSFLYLSHIRNTGAAFGLLRGASGLILLIAAGGVALFAVSLARKPGGVQGVAAALIAGGALGNVVDRIVRGSVVDFIDLRWWPAFNVADSAITLGAALLLIVSFRHRPADA